VRTLIVILALALPLAAAVPAAAAPTTTPCPTFRVLHDNPMAGYDAGTYDMQVWGNLTCKQAVGIFQKYLLNPKSLPRGWKPDPTQSAFDKGNSTGFSLALVKKPRTPNPNGSVANCPTFRVVGPDHGPEFLDRLLPQELEPRRRERRPVPFRVLEQEVLAPFPWYGEGPSGQRRTARPGERGEVRAARQAVPQEPPVSPPGTFPDLPDHVRVGFGECAVADPGAHQFLQIVGATRGVIDHTVGDAVRGVR